MAKRSNKSATNPDGLDLPEFLNRKKGDWKWDQEAAEACLNRMTSRQEEDGILLPEGLRLAQTAYEESGFALADGVIPRRWATDQMAIILANRSVNEKATKRAESVEKFRAAMAEKKAKTPKPVKVIFGLDLKIKIKPGASRREGTKAGERFNAMKEYVAKQPNASVAEVIEKTSYRIDDYQWDIKHGNITSDVRNASDATAPKEEKPHRSNTKKIVKKATAAPKAKKKGK